MKTFSMCKFAALAALALSGNQALAEPSRYTCKAGAVTITSITPCYITSYGISVPGSDGTDQESKKDSDPADKKGDKDGGQQSDDGDGQGGDDGS